MNTIQISSGELKNICVSASSAVGGNGVLPILDCLKFEVLDNELIVTGSDLQYTVIKKMEYQSAENFSFCANCKLLCETLKAIPEQPIKLQIDESLITIVSSLGKYTMAKEHVGDYPEVGEIDEKASILFGPDLIDYLASIKGMVSTDELRSAMTGIYIEKKGEDLTLVTTDAHRLGWSELAAPEGMDDFSVIVKDKIYKHLKANYSEGNIQLVVGDRNVACRLDDGTEIYAIQIDSKYPDYRSVTPTENPIQVVVNTRQMMGALERVSLFSNATTNQITLGVSDSGEIKISASDMDFNNEANESMQSNSIVGDGIVIAFNGKLFKEMLSLIPSESFTLHMSMPNRAAIVTSQLADNETENPTKYLLMPVMVSN